MLVVRFTIPNSSSPLHTPNPAASLAIDSVSVPGSGTAATAAQNETATGCPGIARDAACSAAASRHTASVSWQCGLGSGRFNVFNRLSHSARGKHAQQSVVRADAFEIDQRQVDSLIWQRTHGSISKFASRGRLE